jgi:hypothetical protein
MTASVNHIRVLPADVPVGSFVFDRVSHLWVEVTAKPVTAGSVTTVLVIDGFDVPLRFDARRSIAALLGRTATGVGR